MTTTTAITSTTVERSQQQQAGALGAALKALLQFPRAEGVVEPCCRLLHAYREEFREKQAAGPHTDPRLGHRTAIRHQAVVT